jgi:hypothetical protein
VDRLAYPLHYPMASSYQVLGQSFLLGVVLSHRAAVGSGALLGDERPLDLDTCEGVDYLGHGFLHRVYGFYHGRITLC